MKYHPLGRTGVDVSAVSFGTAPIGGLFGPVDEAEAENVVRLALDSGITFFDTAPYYGLAEERLGRHLGGDRASVLVGTKVGRYGDLEFDFRPETVRRSVEESLRRLRTDHVDVLQLHDFDYVTYGPVVFDAYEELLRIKAEGLCRFVGVTGYPIFSIARAMEDLELDVALNYAHATLLNDRLTTELLPIAERRGVGLLNAAAVALGLLTPGGTKLTDVPVLPQIRAAAEDVRRYCAEHGIDLAFLANQYAIQRSGCPTTVVGTTRPRHLESAVRAVDEPIDEEALAAVLAITEDVRKSSWIIGLPENNGLAV